MHKDNMQDKEVKNISEHVNEVLTVGYKCAHCGKWYAGWKEGAEQCCLCNRCGKISGRRFYCEKCEREMANEKERKRFEKATKVTPEKYDGKMVFCDETERYYLDTEEAIEDCEQDGIEKPEYLWGTVEIQFCYNFVTFENNVIENVCDNHHEGATDYLKFSDEFKAAFEKFVEENKEVVSYETDYSTAIILDK